MEELQREWEEKYTFLYVDYYHDGEDTDVFVLYKNEYSQEEAEELFNQYEKEYEEGNLIKFIDYLKERNISHYKIKK